KNLRMVKTGIAAQRVSPRDAAMMSEDIDISDTSNSAKRSCRQNISDGCTTVTTGLIPCGTTRPSISGRVRSLSESAMLSSRREAVMKEGFRATTRAASCCETHRSAIGFVTAGCLYRRYGAPQHEADLKLPAGC